MGKVLIATGGTGGHIYPAIVIGKYLKKNNVNVIFTGRANSMEYELIKKYGFEIREVKAEKFKGIGLKNKLKTMIKLIYLIWFCVRILKKEQPDFIIGTGGYVAAPVVIAAALLRINSGICEQNAYMGFGNRFLSLFAKHIFLAFKKTEKVPFYKGKTITGNFIREEFFHLRKENSEGYGVLVFGGSQGSNKINDVFCKTLEKLTSIPNLKIYHITGSNSYIETKEKYELFRGKLNFELYEYFEDIYKLFEKIQVVICRAGATSISEIFYTKKRAILIPYPYAADNHQWYNALQFCKTGRGVIIKENILNADRLFKWINFFLKKERFTGDNSVIGNCFSGLDKILSIVKKDK